MIKRIQLINLIIVQISNCQHYYFNYTIPSPHCSLKIIIHYIYSIDKTSHQSMTFLHPSLQILETITLSLKSQQFFGLRFINKFAFISYPAVCHFLASIIHNFFFKISSTFFKEVIVDPHSTISFQFINFLKGKSLLPYQPQNLALQKCKNVSSFLGFFITWLLMLCKLWNLGYSNIIMMIKRLRCFLYFASGKSLLKIFWQRLKPGCRLPRQPLVDGMRVMLKWWREFRKWQMKGRACQRVILRQLI